MTSGETPAARQVARHAKIFQAVAGNVRLAAPAGPWQPARHDDVSNPYRSRTQWKRPRNPSARRPAKIPAQLLDRADVSFLVVSQFEIEVVG
jgi:hypothetical protein